MKYDFLLSAFEEIATEECSEHFGEGRHDAGRDSDPERRASVIVYRQCDVSKLAYVVGWRVEECDE